MTAHCTCMAGAGEACSHIGATLFAVETAVRLRDSQVCTDKKNMWLPAHSLGAGNKRIRDIDFSSSKKKKQRMDNIHLQPASEYVPEGLPQALPSVTPPTEEELEAFHAKLADAGVKPALFMVHPKYSAMFEPPCSNEPLLLRDLTSPEAHCEDLPALIRRAEKTVTELSISEEMVKSVEQCTREQSKCAKWYAYRAGRITASVMKNVCSTNVNEPSMSLLKKICYPEQHTFSNRATTWGLEHEAAAIASYAEEMKNHTNFSHQRTGVYLSEKYPHMAASPDSCVSCTCCGMGIVEVKCPYSLCKSTIPEGVKDPNFCLEEIDGCLRLKRQHSYFFQVQTQMAVCGVSYCDFVVWSPMSLHIERVEKDDAFFQSLVPAALDFFTRVILPELFAQYFSKRTSTKPTGDANKFCYCEGPEAGKMLACDGPQCSYGWFHYSCLGIKRAPKEKKWFCQDCSKQSGR